MCENPGSRANLAVRLTDKGQAGVEGEGIGETLQDLEPYLPIVRQMFADDADVERAIKRISQDRIDLIKALADRDNNG